MQKGVKTSLETWNSGSFVIKGENRKYKQELFSNQTDCDVSRTFNIDWIDNAYRAEEHIKKVKITLFKAASTASNVTKELVQSSTYISSKSGLMAITCQI